MSETDPLLEKLNSPAPKQLTESEFRMLRGKYFTVRHPRIEECGHKQDQINEPRHRNCEYCWWMFFSSHGELVQVTDEAFQTHGAAFIDKLRGVTYRKMFTRFMSTMAAFKLEADAMKAQQDENQGTEQGVLQEKSAEGVGLESEMASREQNQNQCEPKDVASSESGEV